jgi:hypothetical protein
MSVLHEALAPRIAPVILANLTTRYPYHDAHLTLAGDTPRDPTAVHPAFGNSFDWHSSAHSHWTAVQLLEHCDAPALRAAVSRNLVASHIAAETAYLSAHPAYERPYGWAWALLLAAEREPELLHMAGWIADAAIRWLEVLPEPVRHGVHSNTAFALARMLDAARALHLRALEATIVDRALTWFGTDRDWPEQWERSGTDFLSPGLAEADLMLRVLPHPSFASWWNAFLPALTPESRILAVVEVPDVTDGQIVHWHGLNLSRAGMLARIAETLREPACIDDALRLYRASVDHAVTGNYLETHWLATFAWDAATSIDRASKAMEERPGAPNHGKTSG